MSGKHIRKYYQKYYLIFYIATCILLLNACSTTKKVPNGDYLLTKNSFTYLDKKDFSKELPEYVLQKPNKKQLFFIPFRLWFYNAANAKYDTIINEYMTYPSSIRKQKLRDSLFVKYNHPEYKGKSLYLQRLLHNFSSQPVIWDKGKTEASANNIRKRLVYRGYWDAQVDYQLKLDSAAKKAKVAYQIRQNEPTIISDYYYKIYDPKIKSVYESELKKSIVRIGQVLDQTKLEAEVSRINDLMRERGYFGFNNSNEEIFFTADTLKSRKNVPLILEIEKDENNSLYHISRIGKIKVDIEASPKDVKKKDSALGINFEKSDEYRTSAIWRAIILKPNEIYNQKNLDLTKRNLASMNNFSVSTEVKPRVEADSLLDVTFTLNKLKKYEFRVSTDLTYSQILNFGVSPSVDLTTRNILGVTEYFNLNLSGNFGSVKDTKNPDKKIIASEISLQGNLNFPKLLLPFRYYKIVPKRYSPTSSINLGASIQNNLGLGRLNINGGINYYAHVDDVITHKLSILNTQFSLTKDKDNYYNFFPRDKEFMEYIANLYDPTMFQRYLNREITSDQITNRIIADPNFQNSLSPENKDIYSSFVQSLTNKERQTQNVIIASVIYNFIYNEIGKKNYVNPFYLNAKIETSGNILGLFGKKDNQSSPILGTSEKTIFSIPFSQFVKIDLDVRKYFQIFGNHTLALRQFIGIGIPYGNSKAMPFVRSYMNGGSNDIRAWRVYGGLGPADSQADVRVRSYAMDNLKLTTNIEYRMPFNKMFEGALFMDAGNIWSLNTNQYGDLFKFNKFIEQMGVGAGLGIRLNIAYITLRLDAAYRVYDPNVPQGERWVIRNWQPLKPVLNFAFGYPF